ncbi:hypothetical protein GCM10023335_11090 [Streptomyces siamensis]|uniref:Uncharacterized protein n=1 Tax=Streptomyces siamensis TaxID=1274986 RepID=A0ABP9IIH1_9ACTN
MRSIVQHARVIAVPPGGGEATARPALEDEAVQADQGVRGGAPAKGTPGTAPRYSA